MTLAPIPRATLDLHWTQLRAVSGALCATWRRQDRLPRPGPMKRLFARIARRAIAALERTLRQLLALEAARAAPEVSAASPRPSAPRARAASAPRRRRDLSADDPADWTGIAFRVAPSAPAKRMRRAPRSAAAQRPAQVDGTALAIRLEALTRALADPTPLIRRMARRLGRESGLLARLAARRPTAPHNALAQVQRAIAPHVEAMLRPAPAAHDTS
ncbi:MAG: hypothetical protein NW203_12360 [Hyphomonadaceae bacterium]|nr:hypothetical protein [Hyphomonadaceae bacterium]